jgi:2-C-methyl-D-erythritol 4-phosphate cytidylyltransferase
MDGTDKVWVHLQGEPVILHSLRALAPLASRIVVVVRAEVVDRAREQLISICPTITVVPGGIERRDSVLIGLAAVDDCPLVAVHDAARPLATPRLIAEGVAYLGENDGAIPVLPVRDTVKRVDNGRIVETLERAALRLAQTPQIFRTSVLLHAHQRARHWVPTDDAAVLEASGRAVAVFPGDPWNLKITTKDDLELAEMVLARRLAS